MGNFDDFQAGVQENGFPSLIYFLKSNLILEVFGDNKGIAKALWLYS